MSQTLTPLEFDFVGDLYHDDHQIWEIFDFVRLYHNSLSDQEVFQKGQKILSDLLRNGWVEIVDVKNKRNKMDVEQLQNLFETSGISLMTKFDSTVWVEITAKGEEAYASSKPLGNS